MADPGEAPLWVPDSARVASSRLRTLAAELTRRSGESYPDYRAIHGLSIAQPDVFWDTVWDVTGVTASAKGTVAFELGATMSDARFFPEASLNYAANLLSRSGPEPAILFADECGSRRVLSWDELRDATSSTQQALASAGVGQGDRVAAWLPNLPEAVILLAATASLGAVFSSCSPDFGVPGVLDRFGQIEPKVLVAADGYHYGGRAVDCLERLRELCEHLPSVETLVVVPNLSSEPDLGALPSAQTFGAFVSAFEPREPQFAQLPFDHPLYVLYSSGTTGAPKSIVHRSGGILLKHLVEHQFQCDVRPGDRVFYFTTLGWMMWNWLVSALASGATIVLFDGNPVHPGPTALFDLADELEVTLFGTSARFIESTAKAAVEPAVSHQLTDLRTITSTGSPLSDEGFRFVYRAVKSDVHLASISGGTDLCGCLVAGDPTGPVRAGEIQVPALGMDIDVLAPSGEALGAPDQGELVCRSAFPTVPLGFWGDDGTLFHRAYFEAFPGLWHQGDFASWTPSGGIIIHGRSDATLNPGGVRIGTAEIYRHVETVPEVVESLVVGHQQDNDVQIVLFVVLEQGRTLDDELVSRIRRQIREGASPRHVPALVLAVADLPRTRSGKLSELAVRDVLAGRPVGNTEALANPETLEIFRDILR